MRQELVGVPISPGVGVGRLLLVADESPDQLPLRRVPEGEEEAAWRELERARRQAIRRLARVQERTARELGIQEAAIYAAQQAVLQDPQARAALERMVFEERLAPESAIATLIERFGRLFEGLEGGDLKNWAADLRDPWTVVLRELQSEREGSLLGPGDGGPVVLAAEELTPSLVARLPRERIAGILCERGGRYSHGAVVARSHGIPTVSGLDQLRSRVREGESCIVYGDEGRALLGAGEEEREQALRRAAQSRSVAEALLEGARDPARLADGEPVWIQANIETPRDLDAFDLRTVDGIGLFRTEFAYMERPSFPSVEEQVGIYRSVLERLEGKPVTFRTLDVGGDKQLRYLTLPEERNPALGWRGLRVGLVWQDLLLIQLQALLASRAHGRVRILLPMVTLVEEVARVKTLLGGLRDAGAERGPAPLGAMVEVPALMMSMRHLLDEVDFFSVGTNDLTQYLFAVDRDNPWVSSLYQPYHPAHLRVLRNLARLGARARRPPTVCGELAGQHAGALFLVGVGFRSLSMAGNFVPEVKALLARADKEVLQATAARALRARSSQEARAVLGETAAELWRGVLEDLGAV